MHNVLHFREQDDRRFRHGRSPCPGFPRNLAPSALTQVDLSVVGIGRLTHYSHRLFVTPQSVLRPSLCGAPQTLALFEGFSRETAKKLHNTMGPR